MHRCAGCPRPPRVRGRRPHPDDGGRRRSTARRDCRFRVVPVRRRADRRVARAGRVGGERSGWRRLGWNPAQRVRFPAPPHRARPLWGSRTPKRPFLPVWGRGVGGISQGEIFGEAPACHLSFQAAGRPNALCSRVGEEGKGDEGATVHGNARASLPGTHPLRGAHPAHTSGARALAGAGWLASPGVPSFVSGSRTPRLPLLPLWEKGAGGMRGHTRTGMPAHLCQERSPCAVRAPPARMGAGRPRTRRNPQVRALAGAGWLASPGVPSFVSGSRTPRLPLLPVWEQGARGMRGQTHTGMQKITHRSQELYP